MAKRISTGSVNWALISKMVWEKEKPIYMSFKGKFDKFQRKVSAHPAELPKINFDEYKSKITVPGVVDTFKKSYEALSIPYPSDNGFFAKLEEKEKTSNKIAAEEEEMILKQLADLQAQLKLYEAEIPYSQLSLEELGIVNPDMRIDPDKPRLWPQFIDQDYPDDAKIGDHSDSDKAH